MRSMIAALALFCCALTVQAETITVCATGCDHTSINDAVIAAEAGDTIHISAGEYYEGVVINTLDKNLTIVL